MVSTIAFAINTIITYFIQVAKLHLYSNEFLFLYLIISFSKYNNLLYLETLSVLHGAPVFICPAFTPTAMSAMVVSYVSPDL